MKICLRVGVVGILKIVDDMDTTAYPLRGSFLQLKDVENIRKYMQSTRYQVHVPSTLTIF
jgi:hypothetical protein